MLFFTEAFRQTAEIEQSIARRDANTINPNIATVAAQNEKYKGEQPITKGHYDWETNVYKAS